MVKLPPALVTGAPVVPLLVMFEVTLENASGRTAKPSPPQATVSGALAGALMRRRTWRYEFGTVKLVFLRPLSAATKLRSGMTTAGVIGVHVELQPVLGSTTPELLLASSASIFTVPT